MTRLAAAAILAGALFASAAAQVQLSGNTERVESGRLRSSSGMTTQYRIRLLPVASFPGLPAAVAAQLRSRGCMIPQTFEAQQPENVIQGAFLAPNSEDWAALCSVSGTTSLYVFFDGRYGSPSLLRSQPDTAWLGHEPGNPVDGSAWGISTRALADLRESPDIQPGFPLDHDGIEDSDLDRSAAVRYFHHDRWTVLVSQNFQ